MWPVWCFRSTALEGAQRIKWYRENLKLGGTLVSIPYVLSHNFSVHFCLHTPSHRSWELSRGFRETLSTPDFNLEFPCQVLAKWTLYTHTYKLARYCTAQQTARWACRHWQLPVVLFPQVPSVTQPLPDRSNHRQGLFRSHPRVKAQRVPKEMSETYKSIALFFSLFFWPHFECKYEVW